MRINKYLADCGVASRRKAEQLILDGVVTVNGKIVTDLSTQINPKDKVAVNGETLYVREKDIYLIMNKPKGCISSVTDDRGRKTVIDIVSKDFPNERLYPVGRLDYDTEGMLIITTDGYLCNRLTHPANQITKTYVAKIEGQLTEQDYNKIRNGVEIDGKLTHKCKCRFVEYEANKKLTVVEIVINEGLNRQIRKMFEAIGKNVAFLKRVAIGDLRLSGVDRGKYRRLNAEEVDYLKRL